MQWLADLIIEKIGIPPTFIDRGDPAVEDFVFGDFTLDDGWHELDLSGIVPAGATAVLLFTHARADATAKVFRWRKHGNVNAIASPALRTVVANLYHYCNNVVAVDADRKIDYMGTFATFDDLRTAILGWWL